MTTLAAEIRSLASAQKSSAGVSLYSRFINRPLGRVLAVLAVRARISPNTVSLLSAGVTVVALVLLILMPPTVFIGLASASLLVFGFALDSADGQVARITDKSSPAGEWLDHIIDSGKMVAVHGAILVAAFIRFSVPTWWLLVPLCFIFVSTVMFAGTLLTRFLQPPSVSAATRKPSLVRAIGLLPADYGILAVVVTLWGFHGVFTLIYTGLFAANAVILLMLLAKWSREVSRPAG